MKRLNLFVAGAVIFFWTAVIAVPTALAARGPHGASVAPSVELVAPPQATSSWPEPKPPFDETPITPIESAGAPMVL